MKRALLCLLPLAACAAEPDPSGGGDKLGAADPAWVEGARLASEAYAGWGRVDEPARWAPTMCVAPPPPARARRSASADGATHGRKLYSLFAKDRAAYTDEGRAEAPVGQVLAKEAWIPVEVEASELPARYPEVWPEDLEDGWLPYATGEDGRTWRASERGPLFLMMKLDPETPGTDQGWIYATVEPGGEVTSAGAMESCMECHRAAQRDRQFGLP